MVGLMYSDKLQKPCFKYISPTSKFIVDYDFDRILTIKSFEASTWTWSVIMCWVLGLMNEVDFYYCLIPLE